MKDLEYYLALPYRTELCEDKDAGGYTVSMPELPGCLSCGETVEEALRNIKDAKKPGLQQLWKTIIQFQNQKK